MVGSLPSNNNNRECRYHEHYIATSFSFTKCFCCVVSVIFLVAVIVGVIALIVLVVIKPRKPELNLESVQVQGIKVQSSPTAMEEWVVSMSIGMFFSAHNPNKVGIKYSHTKFYVMYRGTPLGFAVLPSLYQPAHSNTTVSTHAYANAVTIPVPVAQALIKDVAMNDRVALSLTGDIRARVRMLGITSPKVQVSLDCQIVIAPQRHALVSKQCGVDGVDF